MDMMTLLAQAPMAEPREAILLGILGVIGAAAAATYQKVLSANTKDEAQRLNNAVHDYTERCARYEKVIQDLYDRVSILEREKAACLAKYEALLKLHPDPTAPPPA